MSKPATQTALGPMVIVAVDQNENPPLIQDELAYQILPARGKAVVIAAKWRPLRRLLIGGDGKQIPGLWASILCRKRYIDERTDAPESDLPSTLDPARNPAESLDRTCLTAGSSRPGPRR